MSFDPWQRVRLWRTREEVMRPGLGNAEIGEPGSAMPGDQGRGPRTRP